MSSVARVTGPLLDVLELFLQALDDGVELHGWAISKATGRLAPTVYGVVDRLEDAGWISGRWEAQHPEPNKPRRRLYQLTPNGAVEARALLSARRGLARGAPRPATGPGMLAWLAVRLTGGAS